MGSKVGVLGPDCSAYDVKEDRRNALQCSSSVLRRLPSNAPTLTHHPAAGKSADTLLLSNTNKAGSGATGRLWSAVQVRSYNAPLEFAQRTPPISRRHDAKHPKHGYQQHLGQGGSSSLTAEKQDSTLMRRAPAACKLFAVITSINLPTTQIKQLAAVPAELHWCTVVVGDAQGPSRDAFYLQLPKGAEKSVIYISADAQRSAQAASWAGAAMMPLLRWRHFGRKNIGFLYAMLNNASFIYDTDDDNPFMPDGQQVLKDWLSVLGSTRHQLQAWRSCAGVFNPYPHFRPSRFMWPRGFPLDAINDCSTVMENTARVPAHTVSAKSIAVVQSVANHDPDVDAIYRLTYNHLPISFESTTHRKNFFSSCYGKSSAAHVFSRREDARATRTEQEQYTRQSKAHASFCDGLTSKVDVLQSARALPAHVVAPFNAQSTLWAYSGFWGLLLPISVHGRVSDIWRSYVVQRVMADAGLTSHSPTRGWSSTAANTTTSPTCRPRITSIIDLARC